MLIYHALFTLSLVTLIVLPAQPIYAESDDPLCFTDMDCDEEELCDGFSCIPADTTCINSDSCSDGQVCNLTNNTCPECSDEDTSCASRCEVPNGYCEDIPTELCQADTDCDEDKLCAIAFAPLCADDDTACEQVPKLGCVGYLRFCGPDEEYFVCSGHETCNADGRCVWNDSGDLTDLSETVVIDEDKADRLREEWIVEIENESSNFGCQTSIRRSGRDLPLRGMALFALVFSITLIVRRRLRALSGLVDQ